MTPPPIPDASAQTLRVQTTEAMEALGARLAPLLQVGNALCLWGPLGAGKSTLARGLIRAVTSPDQEAPSPTFTLVQAYDAPVPIAHFDLYRLKRADEAFELGLDEALDVGAAVIEWPERLDDTLPGDRLDVEISPATDGETRQVRITPRGAFAGRKLEL